VPGAFVLLSAYNGARFIAEQIESIRSQSFTDWKLVIRDDGSSDDTIGIIEQFCGRDKRILLIDPDEPNVGPTGSFGRLLAYAYHEGARFVFLSDQDDVWMPDKMQQQMTLLSTVGREGTRAVLAHSDLVLVDEYLKRLHGSFSEFQRSSYNSNDPLGTLLIHNAVVGCTIAMNRPLLEFALPVPVASPHDWWLAVCAAASGFIVRTPNPTVLYRQHSANVVGVAAPRRTFFRQLARHPFSYTASNLRSFSSGVEQAQRLELRLKERGTADPRVVERVEQYCAAFAEDASPLQRIRALQRSEARPQRTTSKVVMHLLSAGFPLANRLATRFS